MSLSGQGAASNRNQRNARVRTPTVLQMEAAECGAASLAIVLGYFGRHLPLEQLRVACDVSRNGTKASNIVRAARSYGLEARGFSKTPAGVRQMDLPLIVHWNFNHFLVLEGFRKDRFFLSDPARGRYEVSAEEFDESFTGVVLQMKPGSDFRKETGKPGLLRSLVPRLRGSLRAVAFVLLAALGLTVPGLAVPAFTTIFVDEYLIGRREALVVPLLLAMALVMLLNVGLTWLQQHVLLRLRTRLSLSSSTGFLQHVLRLPVEFFAQRSAGEIGARVAINDRVAALLSGNLAATALDLFTGAFYLVLMALYDMPLTLVAVAIAAINLVGLKLVSRKRIDTSRRLLMDEGNLAGATMGGLLMIDVLKATGTESDFFGKWSGLVVKKINAQQELGVPTSLFAVVPPLMQSLGITAVLSIGALRVMQGDLTLGMLLAFQFLMVNFVAPVNRLVELGALLQQTEGDMNRLDDVLRYPPAPDVEADSVRGEGADDREKLSGTVELRGITFGYGRLDPPLIENFSMKVDRGCRVALVGSSGSGKSTIARLVCGLYQPWEGEILLDGEKRSMIARSKLARSLALVDQDVTPFHGTVRDNLSLWDGALPSARIEQAARDACAHEMIEGRGGYDAEIREGGHNFSGGELQRLEIARALALDPSILVLDEATSALDPATEKRVMDHVRARGCTCLIVAHRLSTIRDCDEIVALQHGKVVERGTHEDLMRACGFYAKLIEAE